MKTAIFIPARIGSTRFPKKALAKIHGIPMIVHVLERAKESGISDIFVATDDEVIKAEVIAAGGNVIMTDANLPSGTDRIFAASQQITEKYDIIINLQGDMPDIKPYIIAEVKNVLTSNPSADIATAAYKTTSLKDANNPNVVKAILSIKNQDDKAHKALYFTRSLCPANPENLSEAEFFHHLGIYAYRQNTLEKFVKAPPSYLEKREKLEQLRALENDMSIYACLVNDLPISIDTKEDLEALLSKK
ncbi:3-deoxy-manno-octulosonate cytidylyltransferase [Candidatus Deianiraea vastatrix]|uniref:3-deoxy-manno-octulosonate cytidylyltransferase n=1 Tax=Candidatus Deianiraea vastatrix TaxID=2163644 RepID=A0A5B8XEF2_9RICK|nr:3-deoxy-manno-octulosonate cytidylyltransferase [Candidatus Deianiraea vastatrix]QED23653.1 3-deoxy-manno-octulosonate cytidylyltransferase [Candidatus Deianiraea vastatrix]